MTQKTGKKAGTRTIEKNTICHDMSTERKCYTVAKTGSDSYLLTSIDQKWLPAYQMVAGNPDNL